MQGAESYFIIFPLSVMLLFAKRMHPTSQGLYSNQKFASYKVDAQPLSFVGTFSQIEIYRQSSTFLSLTKKPILLICMQILDFLSFIVV